MRSWKTVLCVAIVSCLVHSCDSAVAATKGQPSDRYHLAFNGFPEDHPYYDVVIQTFDSDRKLLDNKYLGSATPATFMEQDIVLTPAAVSAGIYLFGIGTDTVYYFSYFQLAKVGDNALSADYWVDYNLYFDHAKIEFGINSAKAIELPFDEELSLDYSDRPYYLLHVAPPQSYAHYSVDVANKSGQSLVTYSDSIESIIRRAEDLPAVDHSWDSYFMPDGMYFWARPQDYSVQSKIGVKLTDLQLRNFDADRVVTVDGGENLFFAYTERYGYSRKLRKWNVPSGIVTVEHSFPDTTTALIAVGSDLYIGCGRSLYRYTPATQDLTVIHEFAEAVEGIADIANQYLFIYDTSDTESLFRLSDSKVTDSTKTVSHSFRSSVWVGEKSRLYMCEDGTPITYAELDLAKGTIRKSGSYYDSWVDVSSITEPLIRMGTAFTLATGNGYLFSIDASTTSGIANGGTLGVEFRAATSHDGRTYLLEEVNEAAILVRLSSTPPFKRVETLAQWPNETPRALVETSTGILVLTENQSNKVLRSYNLSASLSAVTSAEKGLAIAGIQDNPMRAAKVSRINGDGR